MDKAQIPELFLWIKDQGGYFKRFTGGALSPWIHDAENSPPLDLESRVTQAFFEVGEPRLSRIKANLKSRQTDFCPLKVKPKYVAQRHPWLFSTL